MTDTLQALVRHSYTASIEFVGIPPLEMRKALNAAGYIFDKGRWVKHEAESSILDAVQAVTKATA